LILPVVGKSPAQISTRAEYFRKTIELQVNSRVLKNLGVRHHPQIPNLLAHSYFALSESYKSEFLYPGKGTDPTKQAALTCATISVVRPLHAPTDNVDREEYLYMNEMLAMRCACGIVAHPVHTRGFDEQRRVYHMLQRLELPSIIPIIEEATANNGEIKSNYKITLSRAEEFALKSLVSLFVVYKDLKIYANPAPIPGADPGED
jgi:hypothetical protein